jgi:hypothetical protein
VRVALDREAVEAAQGDGTPLDQRVRLDDLRRAGWRVSPWTTARDGGATITVQRGFASPAALAAIGRQLNGADGPLRALQATRDATWLGVAHQVRVTGRVDLRDVTGGVAGDQELVARLTGQRVDLGAIAQQLTGQARTAVSVRLVVAVPGGRTARTVTPGQQATVQASARSVDSTRAALLAGAVALAGLAALAAWRARRAGRRATPRARP